MARRVAVTLIRDIGYMMVTEGAVSLGRARISNSPAGALLARVLVNCLRTYPAPPSSRTFLSILSTNIIPAIPSLILGYHSSLLFLSAFIFFIIVHISFSQSSEFAFINYVLISVLINFRSANGTTQWLRISFNINLLRGF